MLDGSKKTVYDIATVRKIKHHGKGAEKICLSINPKFFS